MKYKFPDNKVGITTVEIDDSTGSITLTFKDKVKEFDRIYAKEIKINEYNMMVCYPSMEVVEGARIGPTYPLSTKIGIY